jgi:heterodisulfide reductase subunit C
VVRAVQDGDLGVVTDRDDIWHCTTCFSCQERCPKGVLITQCVLWLRAEAVRRGLYPASHVTALREIATSGNTFPLDDQVRAVRGRLSLPLDPPDCAHDEEELATFQRLLDVLGFRDMAPERRPYAGDEDDNEGGEDR